MFLFFFVKWFGLVSLGNLSRADKKPLSPLFRFGVWNSAAVLVPFERVNPFGKAGLMTL